MYTKLGYTMLDMHAMCGRVLHIRTLWVHHRYCLHNVQDVQRRRIHGLCMHRYGKHGLRAVYHPVCAWLLRRGSLRTQRRHHMQAVYFHMSPWGIHVLPLHPHTRRRVLDVQDLRCQRICVAGVYTHIRHCLQWLFRGMHSRQQF